MDQLGEIFREWSFASVCFRMFVATVAGILIGMDREYKNKGAGIKTHALVCLGSALCMIVNEYALYTFPGSNTDITRIGAQVISGIGFLGVGTIIITGKNEVKGLTTAAGLWVCAGIGLAAGIGFWEGTLFAIVLFLCILKILKPLDVYLQKNARDLDFYVEFSDRKAIKKILEYIRASRAEVHNFNVLPQETGLQTVEIFVSVKLKQRKQKDEFLAGIRKLDGVFFAEEI